MRQCDPADVAQSDMLLGKLRATPRAAEHVRPWRDRTRPPPPPPPVTQPVPSGLFPENQPFGLWIAENHGELTGLEIAELAQIQSRTTPIPED